jgi:AcrR family transcriptional regulator
MNLDTRREREKQERRESIVDAAEQVFFSKGYDRCSMEEIARKAELSRALIYVYFKDKAAIMRAIVLRAVENLRQRFASAVSRHERGIEQIAAIGMSYYRFSQEEPAYFDVLTQAGTFPHLLDADESSEALQHCSEAAMQLMVDALQRGVADGSLCAQRVSDPRLTAYFLRGAVHGVIMEARNPDQHPQGIPPSDELIAYTLQMLSHAMRAQ